MYRVLLRVALVVGVVYSTVPTFWFMAHPIAERWRQRRGSPYRILGPAWAVIIIGIIALCWRWRDLTLYRTPWSLAPLVVLSATGLFIYRQSFAGFTREQLVGRPELEPGRDQRLVTSGIRARVRHPVYLAGLCELLGLTLASGLVVLYVLLGYALVTGAIMLRMEERELERRFGDAYREYKRRVPALLPSLTGRRAPAEAGR